MRTIINGNSVPLKWCFVDAVTGTDFDFNHAEVKLTLYSCNYKKELGCSINGNILETTLPSYLPVGVYSMECTYWIGLGAKRANVIIHEAFQVSRNTAVQPIVNELEFNSIATPIFTTKIATVEYVTEKRYKELDASESLGRRTIYVVKSESGAETMYLYNKELGGQAYLPDEEDITLAEKTEEVENEFGELVEKTSMVYKFKDRDTNKGKGYIILRTEKSLVEQMEQENIIYEVRYDFDLGGETLEVPANCVLDFKGGSFKNGILVGNKTSIVSAIVPIFDVDLTGSWLGKGHIVWFGASSDADDNSVAIQRCMDAFDQTIIDTGTYKVTKTLNGSKSSVIKGGDNIYSDNRISFIPESDDITALFYLPNSTVQYYVIEGIRLMGNKAATIEGAKWKAGTKCIDITSGSNINLRHCMIFGFDRGIVSNFNSYYIRIDYCRFDSVKTCLESVSPNNFIVTNTRVQNFCNFIYKISGAGPLTIDKCAFEVFSGWILFSYYTCQKVNFTNNYVEPRREVLPPLFSDKNNGRFGGNVLFEGSYNNFYATGNEYQVDDAKKVYVFNMIESFISQGNKLFISNNSSNLKSYLELTYNENAEVETTPVRVFTLEDSCAYFTRPSVIYNEDYTQFSRIENATATGSYNGFDPVTNIKIVPLLYTNIEVEAGSGYLFDESRPSSYIVQNGVMYLQGHIIRNIEQYPETLEHVGTLLGKTSFSNMGSRHPYCYIQAFDDENYAPVILKYTYSDRTLKFVSGDKTKGIILDGSYIPIRR